MRTDGIQRQIDQASERGDIRRLDEIFSHIQELYNRSWEVVYIMDGNPDVVPEPRDTRYWYHRARVKAFDRLLSRLENECANVRA